MSRWRRRKRFFGPFEQKPSDPVGVCLNVCPCSWSVSVWLYSLFVRMCVCVCYYIAAAIAVAATANIVATAASHAPRVLCPSVHPVPSTHPKPGEKSDPLQSKAQVLRQNVVLFTVRPNIFLFVTHKPG